jgi:excisionase family DNA binding protein
MRQYARAEWAVQAGWSAERVMVVDEDQGETATSPGARAGFARLVAAVGRHEVGVVVSLEGARLARNGPDWANLLFLCRFTDTLLADEHGIYDLADSSDRMVLGIRGQVSELEIDTSIRRMVEARWNKAERGELMTIPPAGYDIDDPGRLVVSLDEDVAEAIRTVFAKFDELGSARQVWVWWRDQGLKYPVRRTTPRSHPVVWVAPTYRHVLTTLKHPIFAGAYAFGRSRQVKRLDPDRPGRLAVRKEQVPQEEWRVLLHDHHPAYISWERYQANRRRLRGNSTMLAQDDDRVAGAAREGRGLLQGLVRCGHCARRMHLNYGGRAGGPRGRTPQYLCQGAVYSTEGGRSCQLAGGQRIDAIVVEAFLSAVEPARLEIAAAADELADRQSDERRRLWELQIERAEYEAKRAERGYMAIDPDNRLVARTLERLWNERLVDVESVRVRAAESREVRAPLDAAAWERLRQLAEDLPAVWKAPSTADRDRKRLLRCLIEEVQLFQEETRRKISIIWKGGAKTERWIERRRRGAASHRTSEDTVELVRKLAEEFDDTQIARILNKQGRRTGLDNPFDTVKVQSLRGKNRIPVCKRRWEPDPVVGPFTADQAAEQLGVAVSTVYRWLEDGLLAGRQATPGAPWRIPLPREVRDRLAGGEAPAGWVGVSEAARRLGLSTSHVSYMVKSGKLPAVRARVGKRTCWRIDVSSATCGRQTDLVDQMQGAHTTKE